MRCPADFDSDWSLRFLAARAVPSLEIVSGRSYRRAILGVGGPTEFELRIGEPDGAPTIRFRSRGALTTAERRRIVGRLFDLETDLSPFRRLAARDPVLGPAVARRPGLRRPLVLEPFEGVVRAVVGQQVSVAAATTVVGRIVARFGLGSSGPAGLLTFPAPTILADAGAHRLAQVGLTRARAGAIASLARLAADGTLDWAGLARSSGPEAQRTLESFPGIGPWTASYLRMRVLGDPDAFPHTDLGVIRALERRGIAARDVLARAERWRPWRAYATLHLWSLE